jgi:hypothetical protein
VGRWADIQTRVQDGVGDITAEQAQALILDTARKLNAEARWLVATVSIGTTVDGTGQYDLTDSAVDYYSVIVNGLPFYQISPSELEEYDANRAFLIGSNSQPVTGVFCEAFSSTGDLKIELRPTPDTTGLTITGRRVLPITVTTWATEDPPWPYDFDQDCIHGALALGLAEHDERLESAQWHEERFERAIRRLKSRRASQIGKGAIPMPLRRR